MRFFRRAARMIGSSLRGHTPIDFCPLSDIRLSTHVPRPASRPGVYFQTLNGVERPYFSHLRFFSSTSWVYPDTIKFAHTNMMPNAELMRGILDPRNVGQWQCQVVYSVHTGPRGQVTYGTLELQLGQGPPLDPFTGMPRPNDLRYYLQRLCAWKDGVTPQHPTAAILTSVETHDNIVIHNRPASQ